MNAKIWTEKKQKLSTEAASLQRQLEGVKKKLDEVLWKLNFMTELEERPAQEAPEAPEATIAAHGPNGAVNHLSLLTLEAAAKKYAERLKEFTKEGLVQAIKHNEPNLHFNPKSMDRVLVKMVGSTELMKSGRQGRAFIYQIAPF